LLVFSGMMHGCWWTFRGHRYCCKKYY